MSKRIIYLPLESYKERYTMQWSALKTGWLEREWIKYGIPYLRIDGKGIHNHCQSDTITLGMVVDPMSRAGMCFAQVLEVMDLIQGKTITENDVIYFDDFWHPGIEMIPYICNLMGIKIPMYCFCHAQSVDEYDFTANMKQWIRPFEKAIFNACDGIFTSCPTLRSYIEFGFYDEDQCQWHIKVPNKVHATGHPFNYHEVLERMPTHIQDTQLRGLGAHPRFDQVVWSSRWDDEKNPLFFLDVVEKVLDERPNTMFVICTSAPKLRSNNPILLERLETARRRHPDKIRVEEGLTKEEYYEILSQSKIQFNCALQDWVAITLMEATVAGCYPIYPHFRSFPETFLQSRRHTYEYPGDVAGYAHVRTAADTIIGVLEYEDLWTTDAIHGRNWIHERFEHAALVQAHIMGVLNDKQMGHLPLSYDPFSREYVEAMYPKAVI